MAAFTEFVPWGNGPGDTHGYSRSLIKGMYTTQQFACILGVNQGAARDIISGRRTGAPLGAKIKGTWFINCDEAISYFQKRAIDRES